MAKRQQGVAVVAQQKIEEFTHDLERLLGHARTRAEGWLGQRTQIAKHLETIRDTASGLLHQLGQQVPGVGEPAKRSPVRRRRKMSAAARKAISDAQKKRWALQK